MLTLVMELSWTLTVMMMKGVDTESAALNNNNHCIYPVLNYCYIILFEVF